MKKTLFLLFYLSFSGFVFSQQISTLNSANWNTLRYSGFYESMTSQALNSPNNNYDYFWGINIAHSVNKGAISKPYHWGGQMLLGINRTNDPPAMYIRSTNEAGTGQWAKVLTDKGNQLISGNLDVTQNINAGANIRLANGEITYIYNDNFAYDKKIMGNYAMKWVVDSWHLGAPTLWLSGAGGVKLFTGGANPRLVIKVSGDTGIGTSDPQYKLDINGTIKSRENLIVGDRVSSDPGEINRIAIKPYRHTGGTWNLISRDQINEAFLDISYAHINAMSIKYLGGEAQIGIGVKDPKNKLDVAGTIRATEVKVETGWADFVFDKDYKLPTLQEVEAHINEHKHLPDIPSEKEVKENGVSLGEMQAKLLQKIEELTLYVIEQEKTIKEQGKRMNEQEERIEKLQTKLENRQ